MADVFFSYSSSDRDRVKPVHEALSRGGFRIFWDLEVPPGSDWDAWIRQHLVESRCVVVFWSQAAVRSQNVRHEVVVARELGKLIPVLLEPIRSHEFPMGCYTTEAADLTGWTGSLNDPEWQGLIRQVEQRSTPEWVELRLTELEYRLQAETSRKCALEETVSALRRENDEGRQQYEALSEAHQRMDDELQRTSSALENETAWREELEFSLVARAGSAARNVPVRSRRSRQGVYDLKSVVLIAMAAAAVSAITSWAIWIETVPGRVASGVSTERTSADAAPVVYVDNESDRPITSVYLAPMVPIDSPERRIGGNIPASSGKLLLVDDGLRQCNYRVRIVLQNRSPLQHLNTGICGGVTIRVTSDGIRVERGFQAQAPARTTRGDRLPARNFPLSSDLLATIPSPVEARRLSDTRSATFSPEIVEVTIAEGDSMKEILLRHGADVSDAVAIQSALVANFSFDFRAGQRLQLEITEDPETAVPRPWRVSLYEDYTHLGTVAMNNGGFGWSAEPRSFLLVDSEVVHLLESYESSRFRDVTKNTTISRNPLVWAIRAASYARLGQHSSARHQMAEAVRRFPNLSVESAAWELEHIREPRFGQLMDIFLVGGFPVCAGAKVNYGKSYFPACAERQRDARLSSFVIERIVKPMTAESTQQALAEAGLPSQESAGVQRILGQAYQAGERVLITVESDDSNLRPLQIRVLDGDRQLANLAWTGDAWKPAPEDFRPYRSGSRAVAAIAASGSEPVFGLGAASTIALASQMAIADCHSKGPSGCQIRAMGIGCASVAEGAASPKPTASAVRQLFTATERTFDKARANVLRVCGEASQPPCELRSTVCSLS